MPPSPGPMLPRCRGRARLARAAAACTPAWLALLALAACKPAAPGTAAAAPEHPCCDLSLPAPEPEPSELPLAWQERDDDAVRSSLGVQVELSAAAIAARLESEVPRDSSAERLHAGAAGLVTYSARRTPFAASVRGQTLHFTSQISAHAEVCKPLALLGCVSYAACDPGAVADASVGLDPAEDWSLGPSRVTVVVTRPCVVGPIDATPMIQRGANQQAANLRTRIDGALPSLRPRIRAAWLAASFHFDLSGASLAFSPAELGAAPAELHDGTVKYMVSISGRTGRRTRPFAPDQLPPPKPQPSAPQGIVLRAPLWLDTEQVERALVTTLGSARLSSSGTTGAVVSARAHPTRDGLLIFLQLEGSLCGRLALLAQPELDAHERRIRLTNVKAPPWQRAALARHVPELQLRAFEQLVEQRASIAIPLDDAPLTAALAAAALRFQPQGASTEFGSHTTVLEQVILDPAGLVVVARLDQQAAIVLR
jgi:hypothetical protein